MLREIEHTLILIPGLNDRLAPFVAFQEAAVAGWRRHGLSPVTHIVDWHNDATDFPEKLARLVQRIDEAKKHSDRVSLLGVSAGGPMALNAKLVRPESIYKIAMLCARVRPGKFHGFMSFENRTRPSRAYREAIISWVVGRHRLPRSAYDRILTVRAAWDELAPEGTSALEGPHNIQMKVPEHFAGIVAGLTVYAPLIANFLTSR